MREIKFRAWDKRTNSWFRNGDGFALSWDATEIMDDNDKLEQVKDNIIFQQFTGIKVKKIEIYEGDIVSGVWFKEGISGFHGTIEFYSKKAAFIIKKLHGDKRDSNWCYLDEATIENVDGNIYANPELLK